MKNSNKTQHLGENLKEYRNARSLTQQEMAGTLDIGYRTYQDIEKTGDIKKAETYDKILKLLEFGAQKLSRETKGTKISDVFEESSAPYNDLKTEMITLLRRENERLLKDREVSLNGLHRNVLKILAIQQVIQELHAKDRRMYYFTQIMYYCFIRRTEMVKLKVGDFDLVNKTITIRGKIGKIEKHESVVIPKGLEPVLQEMKLDDYPDEWYVFGQGLFSSDVPYYGINYITARHGKFARQLKIDKEKNLYSWKHTGVCAAYYATGKDIYAVMRQLRHTELNTTAIYLKSLGLIQNDVFRDAMTA